MKYRLQSLDALPRPSQRDENAVHWEPFTERHRGTSKKPNTLKSPAVFPPFHHYHPTVPFNVPLFEWVGQWSPIGYSPQSAPLVRTLRSVWRFQFFFQISFLNLPFQQGFIKFQDLVICVSLCKVQNWNSADFIWYVSIRIEYKLDFCSVAGDHQVLVAVIQPLDSNKRGESLQERPKRLSIEWMAHCRAKSTKVVVCWATATGLSYGPPWLLDHWSMLENTANPKLVRLFKWRSSAWWISVSPQLNCVPSISNSNKSSADFGCPRVSNFTTLGWIQSSRVVFSTCPYAWPNRESISIGKTS